MRSLRDLARDDVHPLTGVFFDLDDTLLTHGVLGRQAYSALWDLHDAGLRLVAVTGRPSGWAEVFVRQWPIEGAVTENGAVFVVRDGRTISVRLDGTNADVTDRRQRLDALVLAVRQELPGIELSDDTHQRRSDVAWDIGEHVTVEEKRIAKLGRFVVRKGARTARSTVHLHASFERDDKASGAVRFAREQFGEDPGTVVHRWAFIGDSANDAACFAAFQATFGVANVRKFVGTSQQDSTQGAPIVVPPRWVASRECGEGFAEIAGALGRLR